MLRVNMRHMSNAHTSFWDGSLCVYLNLLKQFLPILSKVRRSVLLPSAISRLKYELFSYFLCCFSSIRCLAGERSPKRYSRSCLNRNSISSNVNNVLKNSSNDSAALTTTGTSAKVCCFVRALNKLCAASQKASALSVWLRALARTRFRRVRTDTGLGGFGVAILRGIFARLFVFRFAFLNFLTRNGDNFLGQCCEFFKRARLTGLGWFHKSTVILQAAARKSGAVNPSLFLRCCNDYLWRWRMRQNRVRRNSEGSIQSGQQMRKYIYSLAALHAPAGV
jgi:hypothetical protein